MTTSPLTPITAAKAMSSEIDLAKALGQGGNEELVRHLLMRFSQLLPPLAEDFDWSAPAYRWVKRAYLGTELGRLEPVHAFASVDIDRLLYVERQKNLLLANTEAFVKGLPANNVLLTGARGTGKSSLIRGCASRFFDQGLRLIEVGKEDLRDLFEIVEALRGRNERFILYCDDLSFELGESGYKALKAALDGSVATGGSRILVYATSNRRHLMPEPASDNLTSKLDENGDLHPGEVLEEKLSLAERFGLWLSFYPFTQAEYLQVLDRAFEVYPVPDTVRTSEELRLEALQWAIERGGRSGRVAMQFAKLVSAREALKG